MCRHCQSVTVYSLTMSTLSLRSGSRNCGIGPKRSSAGTIVPSTGRHAKVSSAAMPWVMDEDDPMLDYSPERWINSMIGNSGLLYRFNESLVYKSNVTPREADLMEAAGDIAMRPVTRVVWKGSRPATGTKAVIMELGKPFVWTRVSPSLRRGVVLQMFDLLGKLHNDYGIVHGDIKESNFIWGRDKRLRLIGFASARFVAEDPSSWNSSYVTEAYFAPERMRERHRSIGGTGRIPAPKVFDDYYALAVTLWSLHTGKAPGPKQFNQMYVRRADLDEVEDEMVRKWIRKVFKMAGCKWG